MRTGEEPPALESHLAKYRSLIPSLALLIHLADGGNGPVGRDAVQRAIGWGEYLESHARRIYGAALNRDTRAARALAKRIREGHVTDGFALKDVYNNGWSELDSREAVAAGVELLATLNWVRAVEEPTDGRPRTRHFINPQVFGNSIAETGKTRERGPAGALEGFAGFDHGESAKHSAAEPDNINDLLADDAATNSDDWTP